MKKLILLLSAMALLVTMVFALSSCQALFGCKHDFTNEVTDEAFLASEATCSAPATYYYSCSKCGEMGTQVFKGETLPHTEVTVEGVAPTCTDKGKTEGKKCSVCDAIIVAQKDVAPLGHNIVTDAAVAPTCTKNGLKEGRHCSTCGVVTKEQKVVEATGHVEVIDEAVEKTCTVDGKTEGKHCMVCNEILVAQQVLTAEGHNVVIDEAVAPTCTENGLTEGQHCSVCNKTLVDQVSVPAVGHVHKVVVENYVDSDCVNAGSYQNVTYCEVCEEELRSENVVVPAKGHTEATDAAIAPTCTATGLTEGKHCSVCEAILVAQKTVNALGHTESAVQIENNLAPDCVNDGSYDNVVYCTVCEVELSRETIVVDALGHTDSEVQIENNKAPNCVKDGSYDEVVYCTVCKVELSRETKAVDALGHDYQQAICQRAGCDSKDVDFLSAQESIDTIYGFIQVTNNSYLVTRVKIGEISYRVVWEIIGTDAVVIEGSKVVITPSSEADINYTLKYTIFNDINDDTLTGEYEKVVPQLVVA